MHKSWSHLVTVSIENMIDCKYIIKNILNLFCAIAIEQTNSWYNSANSSSVKKFISFYLTEQGRRKVWNSGGLVVLGGDNVSPLVEIGLTDLPNIGGAKAPPSPHLATALLSTYIWRSNKMWLKLQPLRKLICLIVMYLQFVFWWGSITLYIFYYLCKSVF